MPSIITNRAYCAGLAALLAATIACGVQGKSGGDPASRPTNGNPICSSLAQLITRAAENTRHHASCAITAEGKPQQVLEGWLGYHDSPTGCVADVTITEQGGGLGKLADGSILSAPGVTTSISTADWCWTFSPSGYTAYCCPKP